MNDGLLQAATAGGHLARDPAGVADVDEHFINPRNGQPRFSGQEDLEQEREKVAYLTGEIAELRKRVPTRQPQAAAPIVRTTHATDPLERLFAAIAPNH
jgi:hypothetical protein